MSKFIFRTFLLATTLGGIGATGTTVHAENAERLTPVLQLLLLSEEQGGRNMSLESASRFLIQSTFGPTYEDIVRLSNGSFGSWLNQQFNTPATHTVAYAERQGWVNFPLIEGRGPDSALLNVALRAPDQLRQRVAYALSQIFVVSRDVNNGINERPLLYLDYYDMLMDNAFGNYRDLLEKVTLHTVMGFYLTMKLNAPAGRRLGNPESSNSYVVSSPDENYAREVMQLFSVGLFKLKLDGTVEMEDGEPVPSYTQDTVENFARVFTGWNYQSQNGTEFFNLGVPQDTRPMRSWDEYHDQDAKTLLNGELIPAGQTAVEDLDDALDNIFNHPNVGPFIGKILIQHLVTSNPTPAYVARVARAFNNNGNAVRGDLKAVIRAILLDPEARNGHISLPNQFGKYKEPYIRQIALWRGMHARRRVNNNFFSSYDDGFLKRFKQFPLKAQSVFNFYRPEFSPSGPLSDNQLLAPVSQLFDTESVIGIGTTFEEYIQRHHDDAGNDFATSATAFLLNTSSFQQLVPENFQNPADLIERLNIVFMGGGMSHQMRQILMEVHDPDVYPVENKWRVVIDLLNVIALSPQFWVQK